MQIVEQRGVSDSEDHDGREKQTYRPVGEVRYPALYLILSQFVPFSGRHHNSTPILYCYQQQLQTPIATLFIEESTCNLSLAYELLLSRYQQYRGSLSG
jgi:hypothetical protein